MKVNLVGSISVLIVLNCLFYDVLCLPNPRGTTNDNKLNALDSAPQKPTLKNCTRNFASVSNKTISTRIGSQPYSSLWNLSGTEKSFRATQAENMKSYMNLSVDPCDDFYEYVCGNFENINPIPKDKSENSLFNLLNNNIQNELHELLSQPISETNQEYGAEDKAKVYYKACIDEDTINRRGADPLLNFIDDLGGWPVLDDYWSEEGFDWLKLSIKLAQMGNPAILYSEVEIDLKNSSEYSIYLGEGSLGLTNRDDYLNSDNQEHLDAYRNLIVTVLRLLDVDPEKAEETSKEIVDFEIQLANITTDPQLRTELSQMYRPTTIAQLNDKYKNIDWLTFFSGVLDTQLQTNQSIILLSPYFYGNLTRILKEVEPKTLANYLMWTAVSPFIDSLDENFRAAMQTFKEALTGQQEPVARWKDCIKEVNTKIGMASGALFVEKYFDEDSKIETVSLLSEIKEAFIYTLLGLPWIDEKTKQLARYKVNKTKLAVGYPDFIHNKVELDDYYKKLKVMSGKRFENVVNLIKFSAGQTLKHFSTTVNKETWPSPPAVVNAFFEQTNNRIIIPAGILQPPIFHKYLPHAFQYGSMGAFVGHEMTHGFDDVGREFDSDGNMMQWWSKEAIKGFQEREKCFITQYNNFSVNGKHLQGFLSKGENIADNGGLRQAFQVYEKWQETNGKSEKDPSEAMPGMDYTNNQLFFIAFGQSWCNPIRQEALENRIQTNSHSPGKFRVLGGLQNLKGFSEAFQCPLGSNMNPPNKCILW